ncbi:hypothetical protein FACS189455_1920 [Bacteroidia bacterium]|nr:hypothetical protein FACS189455_1920 [Bacteroidia bacterium]
MFVLSGFILQAQTVSWTSTYPLLSPATLTALDDPGYLDVYFTPTVAEIATAKLEVTLPTGISYGGIENGTGHTSSITYGTPTVSGQVVTVSFTSNSNTLKVGEAVFIRLKVSAACSAVNNSTATVKVLSNTATVVGGEKTVTIGVHVPNIRVQSDAPVQNYANQSETKEFELKLDAQNGEASSLLLTLTGDQYATLSDFSLDGNGITPTTLNVVSGSTSKTTITLNTTVMGGKLGSTVKSLKFKAGSSRCGSHNITTSVQYTATSNCSTHPGVTLTMDFPSISGVPNMQFVSATWLAQDEATPTDVNGVSTDGVTPTYVKVIHKNAGPVDAWDLKVPLSFYGNFYYFDTGNVYYSVNGGPRKQANAGMISITSTLANSSSIVYYKPGYIGKPRGIQLNIPEALNPGQEVIVWAACLGGKIYDNGNNNLFYDYWTTTVAGMVSNPSANNMCGVAGSANTASNRIAYDRVPHIRELPAALSFHPGDRKTQRLRISAEDLSTANKKSVEVFVQLPSWLSLDGNIEDAITWKALDEIAIYSPVAGSATDHGGGKYSIRFTDMNTSNSFLFIKYQAGSCPGTTSNYDEQIHYWLDWHTGDGSDPIRPVLECVSQVFQSVHLFCLQDGMMLSDFELFRTTKGLKDSDNNGDPDDGTIAPDNEIIHNYYMAGDLGYMEWTGSIAGASSVTYNYWYAPVTLTSLSVSSSGNLIPDLSGAYIDINGTQKSLQLTYVSGKGFYLFYDATSTPLKGGDAIEVRLPFTVNSVQNSANSALSSACFVSNTTISNPFVLTSADELNRHGQDVIATQIGTFNLDMSVNWTNDNHYTSFVNNTPLFGSYGRGDNFHRTLLSSPYFKNEVRRHVYISRIVWTIPEGYVLPSPLTLANAQLNGTSTKTLSASSEIENVYTYDVESLFDLLYDGSNSLDVSKWMLPDDKFLMEISTNILATKGASLGKSTTSRTLYLKNPATGVETQHIVTATLDYTGLATTLNLSTSSLPAYGSSLSIPVVTVGNPNSIDLKQVWLYVTGNVSNLSLTPTGGGAAVATGEGFEGRWIKVSDLMSSGSTLAYTLNFTYGGSNDCSTTDKIKIYTVADFDNTTWTPATGSALNLTDYDHVGSNKELSITSAPATIGGSVSVSNAVLTYNTPYTVTVGLNSLSSQGAVKDPGLNLTIPAGQQYTANSAMIEYPAGSPPVAVPAALESALLAINSTLGTTNTVFISPGADFLLPGYLAPGTDVDREIKITMEFTPKCETVLTGIRYSGTLNGLTACGDAAKEDGRFVFTPYMFPNVVNNYLFQVNNEIADGNRAFNEQRTTGTYRVTLRKLTGPTDNISSTDHLLVTMPKEFDLSGTASITSGLGAGNVTTLSNTVTGATREIQLSLPVSAYNSAVSKGVGIDVVYDIPVVYTPSGQSMATSPERVLDAVVVTNLRFDASCADAPGAIGDATLDIAVLTALENAAGACLNTGKTLEITSTGFAGSWYDDASQSNPALSATGSYTYTPTDQATGGKTFYVSAIFGATDYGMVPVVVTMNPEATITVTPPADQCSATSSVDLSSTVSGTPGGSTVRYYSDNLGATELTGAGITVNPSTTTTYYARVTTTEGCLSALTPIVVTVNPTPSFVRSSVDPSVCASSPSLDLSTLVTSVANGVVHYYSDAGCTSELGSSTVTSSGTYYLRAENATTGCKGTVESVVVSLKTETSISVDPVGGATCAGTDINMSVTATGEGALTYQWQKDGTTNVGTGAASYSTSVPGSYTVTVTGECGPVTSAAAVITNKPATAISSQPAAATTVCAGNPVTLSVTAVGEGTLSYQWYNRTGNTTVTGETNPTYSPTAGGTYYVKVSAGCGEVTSNDAVVTINPLPTPSFVSGETTAAQGQAGMVYRTQAGMSDYIWSITGGNITSGGNTGGGVDEATVTWGNGTSGSITVKYKSTLGCQGAETTRNVTLNTQTNPGITGTTTVCPAVGNTYIYATESGKYNYNWNVTGGSVVGGSATSNTVTVEWDGTSGGALSVSYRHANDAGLPLVNANESIIKQTVTSITTPPLGNTVCYGGNVPMSVAVSCTGMPTYQWYKDGAPIGGNSNSYTATSSGSYSVEVTATCGSATSNTAAVTVKRATTGIKTISVNYTKDGCPTTTASQDVTVNAQGTPVIIAPCLPFPSRR